MLHCRPTINGCLRQGKERERESGRLGHNAITNVVLVDEAGHLPRWSASSRVAVPRCNSELCRIEVFPVTVSSLRRGTMYCASCECTYMMCLASFASFETRMIIMWVLTTVREIRKNNSKARKADAYTQSELEDSVFVGPNHWKILAHPSKYL